MTKKDFYNQAIKPYLKKGDKPYNRQLYNDTKDVYAREGLISQKANQNWVYPNTKKFE